MKVRLNDDPEIVRTIREGLKRTGGRSADGARPFERAGKEIKKSGQTTRFFYFSL